MKLNNVAITTWTICQDGTTHRKEMTCQDIYSEIKRDNWSEENELHQKCHRSARVTKTYITGSVYMTLPSPLTPQQREAILKLWNELK